MRCLFYYLLAVNILGFVLMGEDKRRARKDEWRTRERTLLLTAALGGSLGIWAGMYSWRHKTQKRKFTLGVPAILAAQIVVAAVLILKWPIFPL